MKLELFIDFIQKIIMKNKEIILWYLNLLKNFIEINNIEFFKNLADIFYIHNRDFIDFDFDEKIKKIMQNYISIIWEYSLYNNFWYLEWNFYLKDLDEITTNLIKYFSGEKTNLKSLDEKILEFLDKNDLLYLYH